MHQPQTRAEIEAGRQRLQFDEAFGLQLTMAHRRADAARHGAIPRPPVPGGLLDAFDARLPFELTAGQREVSAEIMAELAEPHPMQRLLQGEVGSGKTVVALRAMLAVIDAGGQAALLAPTEVLAAQHLRTVTSMLGDLAGGGILAGEQSTDVVLITGSMPAGSATIGDGPRRLGGGRASSSAPMPCSAPGSTSPSSGWSWSTSSTVSASSSARRSARRRPARPHVLVMTATPIPRSVAMTVFGDLETSTLREIAGRPGRGEHGGGRHAPATRRGWQRAWSRIVEEVGQGRQAYVVAPRISSRPHRRHRQ